MFSVVIPLYNKEQSITNTIQSVFDQTFQNFEIVVVNDGSTDKSVERVKAFDNPRIRIIDKPNGGVSSARNRGIEEAKYEWIAFLDGDDLWKKDHLEEISRMMELYPDDKIFTTSFIRSSQSMPDKKNNSIVVIENYFEEALKRFVTWTSIMCAHISVFENVGVFNEKLNRGEDLDVWARIGSKYRYIKSNKVTAIYVVETGSHLSYGRSIYEKSILSTIDLTKKADEERMYYKRMIFDRLKSNIKRFQILEIIKIINKHKFELLK